MKAGLCKRFFAAFLACCLLCTLLPQSAHAAGEFVNIKDTSLSQTRFTNNYGLAYSLSDGQQKIISYDVPAGGAAVLLFINGTGECSNSYNLLSSISRAEWARGSKLNFVVVESTGADRSAVQSFMNKYDTNGVIDSVYYDPGQSYAWAWYKRFIAAGGDISAFPSHISVGFAYAVIVTQTGNDKYLRFSSDSISSAYELQDALKELITLSGVEPTADVTVAGTQRYDYVRSIFNSVNTYRQNNGRAALTLSGRLTEMAMQRAAECAVYYDHARPSGKGCFTVMDEFGGYPSAPAAENIAAGYISADAVMEGWINSSGHRNNILGSQFTQIGVGSFESNGTLYWVQLFGAGSDTSAPRSVSTPADVTVNTLEKHLDLSLSSASEITLSTGASASVPLLLHTNPKFSYYTTVLRPYLTSVSGQGGGIIATVQYGAVGTGKAYITGAAAGRGTLPIKASSAQSGSLSVSVTVTGSGSGLSLTDERGQSFSIIKAMRWQDMQHAYTGEPTTRGYDPSNISRTLSVLEGGTALTYTSANISKVTSLLTSALHSRYTPSGFSILALHSGGGLSLRDASRDYLRIDFKNNGGRLALECTSLAPGCIKLMLSGREYAFITPGDINLDGEMNANDWGCIMRVLAEAPGAADVDEYPNFRINGQPYDLWALLADMTSASVTGARNSLVDGNDWSTIMYLTAEAWR